MAFPALQIEALSTLTIADTGRTITQQGRGELNVYFVSLEKPVSVIIL